MNAITFIPDTLLSQASISPENVCYAIKLAGVVKRKASPAAQGAFSSIMLGLSNAISSVISDTYLLRMNNSDIWVLSDKTSPAGYRLEEIAKSADLESGALKAAVSFPSGELESATYRLTADGFASTFGGNLKQFTIDFMQTNFENLLDGFATVSLSKHVAGDDLYKFTPVVNSTSLISYDSEGIALLNDHKRINYSNILVCHQANGYCEFIFRENNEFTLAEIFTSAPSSLKPTELNLVRDIEQAACLEALPLPDNILRADSFLAAFSLNGLSLVAVDDKIYSLKNDSLSECGVFRIDGDIFVKTSDGETVKYSGCEKITEVLALLPSGFAGIFMNPDEAQPFLYNGQIVDFTYDNTGIKSDGCTFEYSRMLNCHYRTDDFGCSIHFVYDGQEVVLGTASSLGLHICKTQEKVFVSTLTEKYTLNQLYDCFYKRCTENFLACTFSEIFKTDKLLNIDYSLDQLITALRAEDSAVLRSAFQSMVSKFKNVDDIQSDLVQKITLLEIQRRKIQKLYDEWQLYYPHYLATIQVKWLKYVFGPDISTEILNTEYWKCVAHCKRILSGGNSYVQKSMSEIGSCINKISAALPDEAKRTDITNDLRINSVNAQSMLRGGADTLVAVSAGVEITSILLRGFTATSPLTLSMSAKMLVDSYTKDVTLRKNIKAFGLQALEWWEIFMKGIRIQIIELSNGFNDYNKLCLKRDTEMFKKLPDSSKEQVKSRLALGLKNKISESIDDKFMEILPQFNLRISNIIDDLDSNTAFLNTTLEDFKNNLYI